MIRVEMLKASVTYVVKRLYYYDHPSLFQARGVAVASEGRGGSVVEINRAYEEVIRDDWGKKADDLKYKRASGINVTTLKMPGKKVCIVGSGNW